MAKSKHPTHTSLPHPYKCSKCDYVAASLKASKDHWFDEHTE